MTQEAFERGDWQAVLDSHRLETQDAAEWLRYGSALLHTLEPGPEAGKQQQQAALAFVQVQLEPGWEPQQLALRPGLNTWDLQWEREPGHWLVLCIDGRQLVKPANPQDQRHLLAVLNDLSLA
jgi:hypothetical protein